MTCKSKKLVFGLKTLYLFMSEYCCFPKRNISRFISNVYPVSQEMYAQMDIIS